MKKNKILNIVLTSIILVSTILTPQISYALGDNLNGKTAEASEQAEPEETADGDEAVVPSPAAEDEGDDEADSAEIESKTPDNEADDNNENTTNDEDVGSEEPEDTNINDPPVEEEDTEDEVDDAADIQNQSIEINAAVELEDIFTFDYFRKDGQDIEDGAEIEFNTEYQLQYAWETESDVKAGDTATLQLPDVFEHWTDAPNQDIVAGGTTVGTYSINNGELTFVFNENIEGAAVQNGFVGFSLQFDREKFTEKWEQEIDFDGDGERDLTVIVTPTEINTSMDKSGTTDSPVNAREINWSVDIINGSDQPITNGILKDVLPDGVGDPSNFVVRELTYDIDGNVTVGEEVDLNTPEPVEGEFEMSFSSIPARSGYQVKYTTEITDFDINVFTNDATFDHDDGDLEAKATVDGGERSNPIQKSGDPRYWTGGHPYNHIKWTITVNENGMTIDDAFVNDDLPEGLTIAPNSIEIRNNDVDVTDDYDSEGFPIGLGEVGRDEVYTITFVTEIDWDNVNEGVFQRENNFENKTELTDGEDPLGDDSARVTFWRDHLVQKSGNADDFDYDGKTLNWKILLNDAGHKIGEAVLTDIIPTGLNISKEDINIDGADVDSNDITITQNENGTQTVRIPLGNIDSKVKVSYKTEVDEFDVEEFLNTASLGGIGVGEEDPSDDSTVKPPANEFGKSYEGINYNDKTIDWKLTVEPRREAIDSLTITDTFSNAGLFLLEDTVTVTLGGDPFADYQLTPTDSGHSGFVITINEGVEINEELVVTYSTSYDTEIVEYPHNKEEEPGKYRNKANYEGTTKAGHAFDVDREAEANVRDRAWNSGRKTGHLVDPDNWSDASDRKIAWQVYFNYNQHNLGLDVSVTDTLGYGGEIIEDSIKVSVYDIEQNGDTEITANTLTLSEDYEVSIDDEGVLTVNFLNEVTKRYVIEFETTVQDISDENYVNNAMVNTSTGEYPYSSSVDYDRWDDVLDKEVLPDVTDVYIGEELEWEITANESLSRIRNATLTDTISAGLSFVEDSFTIESSSDEAIDYTLETDTNEDGETVLNISFEDDLTEAITITYTTIVTAENGQAVNNTVVLNGTDIETVTRETEEITATQFAWVGGEFREDRGAIAISKIDSRTDEVITDSEATFELYRIVNDEEVLMGEFTTENGILEAGNLFLGTYILREIEAPDGYRLSDEEIEIEVDEAYGSEEIVFEKDFNNISDAAIDIPVEKIWEDADNQDRVRPDDIEVKLLANNQETDFDNLVLNDSNDWEGVFADLPEYDEAGVAIAYTIEEIDEPEGYESVITENDDGGHTITNSYTPETIEVLGEKTWDDAENQDGKRPSSIHVKLLANGDEVDDVTVTDEANWEYAFTDLPKYDNGKEIEYTVQEDAVEEYEVSYDGLDITNSYIPETTEISVEKSWEDAGNQDGVRPNNVTVNLLDGSKIVESVVLNEGNEWQYTFTDLPVNAEGVPIEYSITENTVSGYSTSVDVDPEVENSYVVTNDYTPEETSVTVTKGWEDGNNQDGNRPNEIQVQLLADGEAIGDPATLSTGNWTYTWDGLDLNADGEAIEYSVEEVNVPEGYTSSINDADHGNIMITNSYTPETTEISIGKAWDDADNQDGVRPNGVTMNLLADGEIARTAVLNSEDWAYTFDNLPVYEDGVEINYTVTETTVEGYSFGVTDRVETDEGTFIEVTNTRTPDETSVTVTKSWNDSNNQDGKQPNEIQVQLLADGEPQGEPVTLLAAEQWTYTWSGLDENADGAAIVYSVEEVNIPEGYTSSINDTDHGNIIITNSYEPELTEVPVLKVWEDKDNQDGERPSNIILNLLNDRGEIVRQAVVQEQDDNEWEYTFKNLPKYENGAEIDYSVTENFVSDYSTEVEENDDGVQVVTNSYTPAETSVTVTKGWNDDNNQDGNRPDEIQVQLLADGEALGEVVTLTAENRTHTWDELDLNADGSAINYSVEEVNVPEGYTSSINDRDHGNIIVTNNYDPELIEIPVQKIWDDAENQDGIRPERVEVNLLADGEKIREAHITEATDWQHVFTDLPRFKVGQEGQEVVYTLNENNVENYSLTNNEFNEETEIHELTNSYTPEETTVTVTKSWNDESNQDGNRPETIGVRVIANEVETDYVAVLSEENDWTHTWEGLALNDAGEPINYSVIETSVSDEYDVSINDDDHGNVIITNSYTPEITDITGEKIWNDADNQDGKRPDSITVNLLSNGNKVDAIEVTEATDWKYEFTGLPKFEDGEEINYTVQEKDVKDYSTEIDGTEITNSYTPGKTSVNVVKSWKDEHNKDARPDSITVNLLADGEVVDSVKLNAENNWQADFVELAEYKDGVLIDYTVEEVAVEGYESSVTGTSEDGFVITNTQKPEEPGDPDPKDPTDPKDPEKPQEGTPGDPEDPTDLTDPTDPEESDGNGLPITGEAATYVGLAVTLLIVGITLAYYNRKSTN